MFPDTQFTSHYIISLVWHCPGFLPFSHKTKYGEQQNPQLNYKIAAVILKTGIATAEDTRSSSALSIPRMGGKTVEIQINETVKVESSVALKTGNLQDTCISGWV